MKKCKYCKEDIKNDAVKCKHCGEFLDKNTNQPTKQKNILFTKTFLYICIATVIITLFWGGLCSSPDYTENRPYDEKAEVDPNTISESSTKNCKISGDACLIILDSYFIRGNSENSVDIRGEIKNIGKGITDHPWHAVTVACYDKNGRVIDTGSDVPSKLYPGESTAFDITLWNMWAYPEECETTINY
jgi:predicted nucleic acid-binding Zn ribbon protein